MTFHFAWVGPGDTAWSATYAREDEDVFAFEIEHSEGNFPALVLDIRNPRRRLLDPGQNVWAWFSSGSTPLFFGRLVAMPENLTEEIVRLTFIARPTGYDALKRALADTMKVRPYWDPVWIAEGRLDDPDVVWESYPELWHVDRTTLALTSSNILIGEDGTNTYGPDDFSYEGLNVQYGATPLRKVRVEAEISWDQSLEGALDITPPIVAAFHAAGSSGEGLISSYTGQGLQADWPKEGQRLQSGWSIGPQELLRADGVFASSEYHDVTADYIHPPETDEEAAAAPGSYTARFYLWKFKPTFMLNYEVKRQYIEKLRFDLEADVQAIYVEPGDEEIDYLSLSSRKVSEPIGPTEEVPLSSPSSNAYLRTDRGRESLEYLLSVARTRLLMRARAVEVSIVLPLEAGFGLSCRQNATITDARLPNGTATGKIVGYRMTMRDGQARTELTVGCSVGYGNTVEASAGDPTYSDGYGDEWSISSGETFEAITGEVTYSDLSGTIIADDGITLETLTPENVIVRLDVINGVSDQLAAIGSSFSDISSAVEAVNAVYTEVWLELKPLTGGPFETDYPITVSQLMVPKTIEL